MRGDVTLVPGDQDASTDGPTSPRHLQRLLDRIDTPVFVFDLTSRRGRYGNAAAASLMRTTGPGLQQMLDMDLTELAGSDTAARIEQGLAALTSGAVRNYQGDRIYPDSQGNPIYAHHTVTRVDLCDAAPVAVGVVSRRPATAPQHPPPTAAPALITVDHHGRVDGMSAEVQPRMCLSASDLLGSHIIDHVHPQHRDDLLDAFTRASAAHPVTVRVCMRVGAGWRAADLVVGALCRHRRPRLALLVTLQCDGRPAQQTPCPHDGGEVLVDGQQLTVQQHEVVTRLLRGQSIATMSAEMHLSTSTVRNHLCAVYAKAGVHSQTELIARLTGRHPS
jgi:DNA-binding CsgD family transcriptional regulator